MESSHPWLEVILKKHEKEKEIFKILETSTDIVVSKGDNYASDLSRIKMKVILGSGKLVTKSIIVKKVPSTEMRAKFIKEWGIFNKEIKIYNEILPLMSDIASEMGLTEPLWGQCIHYQPFDTIMLEDLKELGYQMADRRKGLDLDHTLLAVSSLAKYHAMSVILNERGLFDISQFTKSFFFDDTVDIAQQFQDKSLENFGQVVEENWGPEWSGYSKKISKVIGKTMSIVKDLCEDSKVLKVLSHGDCWTNNIMFKYSHHTSSPISLRFIDFQMPLHAPFAFDLVYFLVTSTTPSVFENNLDEVLQKYHESLVAAFSACSHTPSHLPTLQEVKDEIKRFAVFGLIVACTAMTFMLADPDNVPEMEDLLTDFEKDKSVSLDQRPLLGKIFTAKAPSILKWCERCNVFN